MTTFSPGRSIRRDAGLHGYERALERRGLGPIAGVDEAGRGACAGPLVAAAVILSTPIEGLADSKLLTARRRDQVFDRIMASTAVVSVVSMSPRECDELGVHRANLTALRRAVARLERSPGFVLSDGFDVPGLTVPHLAVWKGDRVCASIAAASVVAKVTRDRLMTDLDVEFPHYGFARHKGYVTADHERTLSEHGPCVAHRMTYANVKAAREVVSR